jgi:hypothetical protein
MITFGGFPPEVIRFLRELRVNNRKYWFDAHRSDYEAFWVAPARTPLRKHARDPQLAWDGSLPAMRQQLGLATPHAAPFRLGCRDRLPAAMGQQRL